MASIVAIVLVAQRDIRGWILGGATAAATLVGFTLTRTTGLPGARGDIGNWGETIAIWSLLVELFVVVLPCSSSPGIAGRRHRRPCRPSGSDRAAGRDTSRSWAIGRDP